MIKVIPYNLDWKMLFLQEKEILQQLLGEALISIHPIGSTSIPGCAAKPIIDIMISVENPHDIIDRLKAIEFQHQGELNIPFRHFFKKEGEVPIHLHVYPAGHPNMQSHILFRNFLTEHSDYREEYQNLKHHLAIQKNSHAKTQKLTRYTRGKDQFIRKILELAGFDGIYIVFCTHDYEWQEYHRIRKEQIFDQIGVVYNPQHPTITASNHYHFGLYKGTKIIGVSHVEFLAHDECALRPFAIDSAYQNQGYGTTLLKKVEEWITQHHKKLIRGPGK